MKRLCLGAAVRPLNGHGDQTFVVGGEEDVSLARVDDFALLLAGAVCMDDADRSVRALDVPLVRAAVLRPSEDDDLAGAYDVQCHDSFRLLELSNAL